jgi:hypothetical protein
MTRVQIRQVLNWNGYDFPEDKYDENEGWVPVCTDEGLKFADIADIRRWWEEWNSRQDRRKSMWRIPVYS